MEAAKWSPGMQKEWVMENKVTSLDVKKLKEPCGILRPIEVAKRDEL
jgi:hypothetical protein